jgi:hypothetical protein
MAETTADRRRPLQSRVGAHRTVQAALIEERDEVAQEAFVRTHDEAERSAEGEIRVQPVAQLARGHRPPPGHGNATAASMSTSSLA